MPVTRRHILTSSTAALVSSTLMAAPAFAARKPEIFVQGGGLFSRGWTHALDGFDTVSYFSEGRPMRGYAEFETSYLGAKWLFINQSNLDTFLADPNTYRPAYGGYCAYALGAKEQLVKGDPEVWNIHGNRLYVNYDRPTERRWLRRQDAYIEAADALWPGILDA